MLKDRENEKEKRSISLHFISLLFNFTWLHLLTQNTLHQYSLSVKWTCFAKYFKNNNNRNKDLYGIQSKCLIIINSGVILINSTMHI